MAWRDRFEQKAAEMRARLAAEKDRDWKKQLQQAAERVVPVMELGSNKTKRDQRLIDSLLDRRGFTHMAATDCHSCHGLGYWRRGPCNCVYREVCRRVILKADECLWTAGRVRVHYGRNNGFMVSMLESEFRADAYMLPLTRLFKQNKLEDWLCFKHHVWDGRPWREALEQVNHDLSLRNQRTLNRGLFWYGVYRSMQLAGRLYLLGSYPLYPAREYFATGKHHTFGDESRKNKSYSDPWLGGGHYWEWVQNAPLPKYVSGDWRIRFAYDVKQKQLERQADAILQGVSGGEPVPGPDEGSLDVVPGVRNEGADATSDDSERLQSPVEGCGWGSSGLQQEEQIDGSMETGDRDHLPLEGSVLCESGGSRGDACDDPLGGSFGVDDGVRQGDEGSQEE